MEEFQQVQPFTLSSTSQIQADHLGLRLQQHCGGEMQLEELPRSRRAKDAYANSNCFYESFESGALLKRSYRDMAFLSEPLNNAKDPFAELKTTIGSHSSTYPALKRQKCDTMTEDGANLKSNLGSAFWNLGAALSMKDDAVESVFDGQCVG